MNPRLLDALSCRNKGRPPIWIMRQAGRYLPEYRALRKKYSFLDMCHQPEIAAEVTQLPIRLLDFDAAILFSDILMLIEAFGVGLHFEENLGPIIERPLKSPQDIDNLQHFSVKEKLDFVFRAIQITKPVLKVPLIGFCGAPFTLASYLIEGGTSRDLRKTKKWMMTDPGSFHSLLKKLTVYTIDYLNMQVAAGVDAIQIFDSWANYLAYPQFKEFSLAYLKEIREKISIPVIIFCKGSSVFASEIATLNPSAISIDLNGDLMHLRKVIPSHIALQGNLDPDVLTGSTTYIKQEASRLLEGMKNQPGYIFNLGHGILPHTPVDSVLTLLEEVKRS